MTRREVVAFALRAGAAGASGLALACVGCAAMPGEEASASSASPAPVFDPATGRAIGEREWRARLASARWVLLGEIHDNRSQHEIRARMLLQWARAEPPRDPVPTIVFEHFDRGRGDTLLAASEQLARRERAGAGQDAGQDAGQATRAAELDGLLDAGGFDRRSWGWPVHAPLFEAALEAVHERRARWVAANVSREEARGWRDKPVDPALQRLLERAQWSPAAEETVAQAIREGHCNMLPASAVPTLLRIQRLRDAAMAGALLAAPGRALLLAGNGHVRRDVGVPRYLGDAQALVVGFVERDPLPRAGEAIAPDPALAGQYDLVCVSPPVAREDPCAAFGQKLSRLAPGRTPSR